MSSSSYIFVTHLIYSETKAKQQVQSCFYIFSHTSCQILDTLKPRLHKKFNQILQHQLVLWPSGSATCISWKFGHKGALQALVENLATRWCQLHQMEIWPPGGATCISCKCSHQVAPLALVGKLTTRWRHLYQFKIQPPGGVTCLYQINQL